MLERIAMNDMSSQAILRELGPGTPDVRERGVVDGKDQAPADCAESRQSAAIYVTDKWNQVVTP